MRALLNKTFSPTVLAILALTALILYTLWQQYSVVLPEAPEVVDGRVDVPADHQGPLVLKGYWRLYWHQLLTPEQLHNNYRETWVPARWSDPASGVNTPPGEGYATYAVDIYFAQPPHNLGFKLPHLYRAAKVWANGELLVSTGEPATSASAETSRDGIRIAPLPAGIGTHLQLVIQVSSFHHVDGGLYRSPIIDSWPALQQAEKWRVFRGLFLFSSTLTLAIYLLVLWNNASAGKEYLYLGLGLLWYSVRIFGTEKLIYYLFPDFSALWLMRAEYYGMFLCVPAYILFIQALYPKDINYTLVRTYWYVGVAASIVTSFVDSGWFSRLRDPFEALSVAYIVYFIACLIVIVWRRRAWSGLVSFLGGVIVLLFVNEVLYYREVVKVHLTPWVYVFVALTSLVFLGQRINSLLANEAQQKALLQQAVADRTRELQQRLEELDEARCHALNLAQKRSEFMAVLSHEIRTPLAGMLGALRLLGRSKKPDRELLGYAMEAGTSLLSVVNESLDASRGAVSRKTDGDPVNLGHLLSSVAQLAKTTAAEKNVGLDLDIQGLGSQPRMALCNSQALRQIVTNLLHNSVKFTDAGKVTLTASINESSDAASSSSTQQPATLCIAVSDTGRGISPADLDIIFEEYVQVGDDLSVPDSAGRGKGLGLAITKRLVDELNGTIYAESTLGQGSCFRVELPVTLTLAADVTDAPGEQHEVIREEPVAVPAMRVLVVEDDTVNKAIVVELLEADKHYVSATELPSKALQLLQGTPYQLCLFDIRLPEMSGIALLARARTMVAGTGPLFVALTANTSESDIAHYRAAGFDYVIEKPVDKVHLRYVLARARLGKTQADAFFLHNDMRPQTEQQLLVDRRQWQNIVDDLGQASAGKLLDDAYHSLRESLAQLEQALEKGRLRDISHFAHKMKSASRSVGMLSVATIAHHLESDPSRALNALGNLGNLIELSYQQLQS
ncbi:ATP-binding protein [Gilvimarinus sp. DA14]|uniref:ATP-binding protein n=1 Tax=Gilvimarinus sp. DA14 TaxID=2956798 RepID=UPI0020B787EB|nr:ATP-binding protein [Gilvimarinus sp. DA14]UTF59435.1 ATP-binding protein [Gilvimarinus sp. DA14]